MINWLPAVAIASLCAAVYAQQSAPRPPGNPFLSEGRRLIEQNRLQDAENSFRKCAAGAHEEGNKALEAECIRSVGECFERREMLKEAAPFYESALVLFQEAGNGRAVARQFVGLGYLRSRLREDAEFMTLPAEAARQRKALREALAGSGEVEAMLLLAAVDRNLHLYDSARQTVQKAAALAKGRDAAGEVARLQSLLEKDPPDAPKN